MVLVGVEGMHGIGPSVFKTFDFLIVILLPESEDKIFVLDDSAISKDNFVFAGVYLIHADIVGLSDVFGDSLTSWGAVVKLGDAGVRGGLTCLVRRDCVRR